MTKSVRRSTLFLKQRLIKTGRMARIIIATSAEISVTVMCYTIPVLQSLWSKWRGVQPTTSSYTMHNRRWVGPGSSRTKQESISSKSEERILGRSSFERTASSPSRGPEKGGINVCKETIITYGERRPDELLWQWDLNRRR